MLDLLPIIILDQSKSPSEVLGKMCGSEVSHRQKSTGSGLSVLSVRAVTL